jgi:hypothetical protein
MPRITKTYHSPFIVDESKLTRLVTIMRDQVSDITPDTSEHYDVHLSNNTVIETHQLAHVLALDNTRKNRITRIVVQCGTANVTITEADFDGRPPSDVRVTVTGEDSKWANETLSAVEEQVERTLQNGFMYQLRRSPGTLLFIVPMLLGVASISVAIVLANRDSSQTMWLTSANLKALKTTLAHDPVLSSDDIAKIWTYQIRNLLASQASNAPLWNWRLVFALAPVLIVSASLIYLMFACYPMAVFDWGDARDWYEQLRNRRQNVWYVVIVGVLIGLIVGMAVFGLQGLFQSAA